MLAEDFEHHWSLVRGQSDHVERSRSLDEPGLGAGLRGPRRAHRLHRALAASRGLLSPASSGAPARRPASERPAVDRSAADEARSVAPLCECIAHTRHAETIRFVRRADTASAWLIDAYDTVVAVDFGAVNAELARVAGVPPDVFAAALRPLRGKTTTGALSWSAAFEHVLSACEQSPTPTLIAELVNADQILLRQHAHVFDDAVDLLHRLRSAGVVTALISNCAEHTRELLQQLQVDELFDDLVLSCEVGAIKPDPVIYRTALARLNVEPAAAVLVDDQPSYCAGAVAIGMRAVQVTRRARSSLAARPDDRRWAVCRALTEVGPHHLPTR